MWGGGRGTAWGAEGREGEVVNRGGREGKGEVTGLMVEGGGVGMAG